MTGKMKVTIGVLVRGIADVFDLDATTVDQFARNLREAGFLPTGGRGKSAAPMGPKEVAVLLTGLLVTDRPSLAAKAVEAFWDLPGTSGEKFGESFTRLVESALSGARPKRKLKYVRWKVSIAPANLFADVSINENDRDRRRVEFYHPPVMPDDDESLKAWYAASESARKFSGGMSVRRALGEGHVLRLAESISS